MPKQKFSRPLLTTYHTNHTNDMGVARGFSKTLDGAKKGIVVRLIFNQYQMACVYDRATMVLLLTYIRTEDGISEHFGRATGNRIQPTTLNLKRIK